jgi:hypothetical protein
MADGKDGQGRRTDAAATVLLQVMGQTQESPAAPTLVAKAAPAPVKPAPARQGQPQRKRNTMVHDEQPASSVFTAPVQRRCQGCMAVFKTKLATEVLCPTCAVAHFKHRPTSHSRAQR